MKKSKKIMILNSESSILIKNTHLIIFKSSLSLFDIQRRGFEKFFVLSYGTSNDNPFFYVSNGAILIGVGSKDGIINSMIKSIRTIRI